MKSRQMENYKTSLECTIFYRPHSPNPDFIISFCNLNWKFNLRILEDEGNVNKLPAIDSGQIKIKGGNLYLLQSMKKPLAFHNKGIIWKKIN